jgi:hypothetical protein
VFGIYSYRIETVWWNSSNTGETRREERREGRGNKWGGGEERRVEEWGGMAPSK